MTFHLQTEKRCNICEWDGVLTLFINSMKIAIIIYRCIHNSAGMMLTNEIEHTSQNKKLRWFIFMLCSDMSVTNSHRLSLTAKKSYKSQQNIAMF